jgi:adenosylmethionine-8-amino-7-oxononanoate aminotransferase
MLPGCFHIPAPWPYRNPFDESDPARLAELCASMLEAEIKFQSPDTVAAFIMEPVLGAGGVIVPHESFMPMVRDICDRHGVLLIADEVITAFGRTGAWTGSRLWGVKPDLACIAKGITNGYFPFGATMISEKIANAFEENRDGFGSIGHGYTYSAHPVGAAAALAALREIDKSDVAGNAALRGDELIAGCRDVAGNAALRGDELIAGCRKLQDQHSMIGDVRGKGLMIALELVADRETKKPLGKDKMETVLQTAYKDGVMVRISGNNVILSPSLVITSDHVAAILSALDSAFMAAA